MRLIDVDAFAKDNAWKWEASGGSEDQYYSVEYLTKRYSVEAIPIDWLNSWLERNKSIVIGMSDYAFDKMLQDFKGSVYGKEIEK